MNLLFPPMTAGLQDFCKDPTVSMAAMIKKKIDTKYSVFKKNLP